MQKKIYVAGMADERNEQAVQTAVSAVVGVASCTANALKAQVLVDFDENTAGIEDAISNAIIGCGFDVLG
ncbi:cation transporter [Treponema brennaborense]|uniref:Heavy metal transport/detoxification protein n=1 Tax=Treponema brennaborense (strain DSM 12168 / CIP 105900 / DD5/3) TaxID=906968 RepID=F4LN53_TREBD|nr:cation transporter [Treponema brennaborense]AEE16818.1 Heavy metal transport/detoxification protein [Treponema brennaborense DSM 12168]